MRIDLQASDFLLTGIVAITQGCKGTLVSLSLIITVKYLICIYVCIVVERLLVLWENIFNR